MTGTANVEDGAGHIAHFEVLAELGRGTFGMVHLVVDEDDTTYAVKSCFYGSRVGGQGQPTKQHQSGTAFLVPGDPSSPRENPEERAFREIAVMKKLRHKNIVQLHAVILDPLTHQYHLVMQYIENGPVAKLKPDGTCKPLPAMDALSHMAQVSAGLEYLHRHGIVHRDIKPENILIGKDRNAYVADFGVSSVIGDEQARGGGSRFQGTIAFMSPELIERDDALAEFGRESDVWAFGVTLYVLLFGRLPFNGWNQPSLIRAILGDELSIPISELQLPPERPESLRQDISDLLTQLLSKDPRQRLTLRAFRRHRAVQALASDLRGFPFSPEDSCLDPGGFASRLSLCVTAADARGTHSMNVSLLGSEAGDRAPPPRQDTHRFPGEAVSEVLGPPKLGGNSRLSLSGTNRGSIASCASSVDGSCSQDEPPGLDHTGSAATAPTPSLSQFQTVPEDVPGSPLEPRALNQTLEPSRVATAVVVTEDEASAAVTVVPVAFARRGSDVSSNASNVVSTFVSKFRQRFTHPRRSTGGLDDIPTEQSTSSP